MLIGIKSADTGKYIQKLFFLQKVKHMPHVVITDITKETTKLYIRPIPVNEIKYWHNTTTGKWTI